MQEVSKKKSLEKANYPQPKSSPIKGEVKGTVETTSLHVICHRFFFLPQFFFGNICLKFINSLALYLSDDGKSLIRKCVGKGLQPAASPTKQKSQTNIHDSLMWTEKYKPKVPNDIIGNQSLVCFLSLFPVLTYQFLALSISV